MAENSGEGIAGKFRFIDIKVNPKDLCLDPNNLRTILTDTDLKDYSSSELTSERLQSKLYSQLVKNSRNNISDLAQSIRTDGWIDEGGFFVEPIKSTNKYLVLEGNRRTCVLKSILANPGQLTAKVISSTKLIPAKIIEVTDKKNEKRIKRILVSKRNMGGVLEFGSMHQALACHVTYMDYLEEYHGRGVKFVYDQPIAKKVANGFGMTGKRVKREMGILRVFAQIRRAGYKDIRENIYSLINDSLASGSLKKDYFEFDNEGRLLMSEQGLARFIKLMVDEETRSGKPIIHNPKQVPKFIKIYDYVKKSGKQAFLRQVEEDTKNLEDVYDLTKEEVRFSGLSPKLEDIEKRLGDLNFSKYKATGKEVLLINNIAARSALLAHAVDKNEGSVKLLQSIAQLLDSSKLPKNKSLAKEIRMLLRDHKKR